jgi:hypothetical protein
MPERLLLPVDLFPRYVRLRRTGMTADEALEDLARSAGNLSMAQQQELAAMIGAWEVREDARREAASMREASQVSELPAEQRVICDNCGRPNRREDYYCYACGHILPNAPDTRRLQGRYDFMDPLVRWGTASFDRKATLVLVPQKGEPIEVDISDDEDVIIGRISRDPIAVPAVDLAPYDAEALGVSRLHLALRRQENTVSITDLGSVNHTYINGQCLHAHELRVLRDGDELRLGRLVLRVRFKFEDRTAPGVG